MWLACTSPKLQVGKTEKSSETWVSSSGGKVSKIQLHELACSSLSSIWTVSVLRVFYLSNFGFVQLLSGSGSRLSQSPSLRFSFPAPVVGPSAKDFYPLPGTRQVLSRVFKYEAVVSVFFFLHLSILPRSDFPGSHGRKKHYWLVLSWARALQIFIFSIYLCPFYFSRVNMECPLV